VPPMVEKLEKYVALYGNFCSIICKVTTTTGLNVIQISKKKTHMVIKERSPLLQDS